MARRRRRNRRKTKFSFNKLLIVMIPILFIGGSLAKYIQEKNAELVYEAQNFYFESDLLSDNTNQLAYTYDTGNDTITFNLKNNIDELRHSEVNIEYVVSITDIQGNQIENKDGNVVQNITGELSKNSIDSEQIEFTNLP